MHKRLKSIHTYLYRALIVSSERRMIVLQVDSDRRHELQLLYTHCFRNHEDMHKHCVTLHPAAPEPRGKPPLQCFWLGL